MLALQQLTLSRPGRCLVQALTVTLAPGCIHGILGPNGAGKTTLLRTLAGLQPPQHGSITLDGIDLRQWSPRRRAQCLGLMTDEEALFGDVSARDYVLLGRHPHRSPWQADSAEDRRIAAALITEIGLSGAEQRPYRQFSAGERRRLALARLLAQQTNWLLLDEPTSNLDLHHQVAVLQRLRQQVADHGVGVILVLHDPALAARICQQVILLHGDGSHQTGPAAELLTAAHLSRLYRHPIAGVDVAGWPIFYPEGLEHD